MSPSMHRSRAREALRGNWPTAICVTLMATLLGGLDYSGPKININIGEGGIIVSFAPGLLFIFGIFGLISLILGGAIHVGYCRYQLNLQDGNYASFSDLTSFMDHFGSALCMHVLRTLAIALGTVCLIIPGIILTYGFSMAGYIMAEDPDCGAVEALKRSWHLMDEHKMDLFVLEMTFIGWLLLCVFTAGIGLLFLNPYSQAAEASFYRELQPKSRYTTYQ